MTKKRIIAGIVISATLIFLVGLQFVEMVNANPIIYYPSDHPNSDSPQISIQSPLNQTEYSANPVCLNFTIIKPDTWWWNYGYGGNLTYAGYGAPKSADVIANISYAVDGHIVTLFNTTKTSWGYPSDNLPKINQYDLILNQTMMGQHTFQVFVTSMHYYGFGRARTSHDEGMAPPSTLQVENSTIFYFTVNIPSPTIEPTQTPSPTLEPNQTQDFTLPIVLAVAVVVAVAALVYLGRRKL